MASGGTGAWAGDLSGSYARLSGNNPSTSFAICASTAAGSLDLLTTVCRCSFMVSVIFRAFCPGRAYQPVMTSCCPIEISVLGQPQLLATADALLPLGATRGGARAHRRGGAAAALPCFCTPLHRPRRGREAGAHVGGAKTCSRCRTAKKTRAAARWLFLPQPCGIAPFRPKTLGVGSICENIGVGHARRAECRIG